MCDLLLYSFQNELSVFSIGGDSQNTKGIEMNGYCVCTTAFYISGGPRTKHSAQLLRTNMRYLSTRWIFIIIHHLRIGVGEAKTIETKLKTKKNQALADSLEHVAGWQQGGEQSEQRAEFLLLSLANHCPAPEIQGKRAAEARTSCRAGPR